MCGEIQPVRADKVLGCTHFDGLRLIQRADDWRLAEEVHGTVVWQSKEHDRGDVIGHFGLQRFSRSAPTTTVTGRPTNRLSPAT